MVGIKIENVKNDITCTGTPEKIIITSVLRSKYPAIFRFLCQKVSEAL